MILYTIQDERILKRLFSDEGYSVKSFEDTMWYEDEYRNSEFTEHYRNAYNWIMGKMRLKIKNSPTDILPIWVWKSYDNGKPDMRRIGFSNKGSRVVRITLNIPDDEVLLSDFDLWHHVLFASYVPGYSEECYDDISIEGMIKSWDRVIDESYFGVDVQATFWELKPEYITKIEYFTAK